jgi:hypothetical protein
VRPRIRLGGLGVLDVVVDGRLVYSKKQEPAPATDDAIVARIPRPPR